MTLKIKFIIFVVIIHLLIIVLLFQIDKVQGWVLIPVELGILLSVVLSIRLYRAFVKPIDLITAGVKSIKDKEFNVRFVRVGQSEVDQLIDVYNTMIDRLREERTKQQEQHYFLERLIEASPTGIIILDFDHNITNINPAARSLLDIHNNSFNHKTLTQLGGDLARRIDALETGTWEIIRSSGIQAYRCHKAHFMDRGFPHYFILIEEITEEIIKSERKTYEKVIRLMSHEINNSIGAVNSILNSCLNYKNQLASEDKEDYENALKVAVARSESLQKFVSNVAEVVRIPPPKKESFDLHSLLQSVHTLMSAEIEKHGIVWEWQLATGEFTVCIDVQQIEQVLVNVLKNAVESIEQEGIIAVITQIKPYKTLIVRDNGKGIPADIQPQLFTPFYSTKKEGKGIGLTMTREILLAHGFQFSLQSHDNGFTDFTIRFAGIQ
jgi:nitrogen fixation/metabolism regulation signal transduction histidine kinase